MKQNLLYLTIIIAILVFGCEKDDKDNEDKTPATVDERDLFGSWNFVSLEINGQTYTDCNDTYNMNTLDMMLDSTADWRRHGTATLCNGGNPDAYNTEFFGWGVEDDTILYLGSALRFTIDNIATYDGTELNLEMLYASDRSNSPIGGVFTLEKE